MKKLLPVAIMFAALGICTGCGGSSARVLYAVSQGTSQVTGYTISGATLTTIGTPVSTGAGSNPVAAVAHPNGKFLYVADSGTNEISVFSIGGSGELSLASTNADAGSQPVALAIQPGGAFLYAADKGANTLAAFSVNSSTGALTVVNGSPFSLPSTVKPANLVQDPFLSVVFGGSQAAQGGIFSAAMTNAGKPGEFFVYTGQSLAPVNPTAIAIDEVSSNRFLYVADSTSATIYGYSIAGDGTLALLQTPFALGGTQPVSMAIDASGTHLFVANKGSGDISAFNVSAAGILSGVTGSPFKAGNAPSALAFDKKTNQLYCANSGSNDISGFSENTSTGVLTSLGATTSTANNPVWLTAVDK